MKKKITVVGRQDSVIALAAQQLTIRQQLKNYDLGQIVGTSQDYYLQRNPVGLKILIYSRHYNSATKKETRSKISIPWVDRTKISWTAIKAVPGKEGYQTGKKYSHYRIRHDSGISQMKVWANTEAEADKILKRAAALSEGKLLGGREGKIISPVTTLEQPENPLPEVLVKPYYFLIVNQRQKLKDIQQGKVSKAIDQKKFWLYFDSPLSYYEEAIRSALASGED